MWSLVERHQRMLQDSGELDRRRRDQRVSWMWSLVRDQLLDRLREYDAEVTECAPENLEAAIAAQLRASGRHSFVAPAGLPAEWRSPEFDWKTDRDGLPADEIEQAEGVVTACFCAVFCAARGLVANVVTASPGGPSR